MAFKNFLHASYVLPPETLDYAIAAAAVKRIIDYMRAHLVKKRFRTREFAEWFYAPDGPAGIKTKLSLGRFLNQLF
jgi:hypothetical protein